MSEDEDNEELPMIFFSSAISDASRFSMPSADQLATQRAREVECEQQLRLLRERHAADDDAFVRADSSGSEGEAALAAAVTELRVAAPSTRSNTASAAALLAALASRATPARDLLAHPDTPRRLPELVASVAAMISSDENTLSDEDAVTAGALLTAAVLAPDMRNRTAALRTLHALLDHCVSPEQSEELGRVMLGAIPEPRARLELSDALRSGAGGGADALSARVRDAALEALGAAGGDAAARWRGLAPGERYTALQLLGRRLAAPPPADDERSRALLLAALAPPARDHDAQHPDQLKVLVGASRLRLLFRSEP